MQLIGHEILSLGGSNPPDDPRTSTTVTWRGRVPYTQGLFSLKSGCLGLGGNPSELALTGACYQVDTHGSYNNWKQQTDERRRCSLCRQRRARSHGHGSIKEQLHAGHRLERARFWLWLQSTIREWRLEQQPQHWEQRKSAGTARNGRNKDVQVGAGRICRGRLLGAQIW